MRRTWRTLPWSGIQAGCCCRRCYWCWCSAGCCPCFPAHREYWVGTYVRLSFDLLLRLTFQEPAGIIERLIFIARRDTKPVGSVLVLLCLYQFCLPGEPDGHLIVGGLGDRHCP